MGLGIGISSSSYNSGGATQPPNPNPYIYRILTHKKIGQCLVVKIKYLDCTNYEGVKILVYKGIDIGKLRKQIKIDPHFSENKMYHSPIARFVPTEEGWTMACVLAKHVAQLIV